MSMYLREKNKKNCELLRNISAGLQFNTNTLRSVQTSTAMLSSNFQPKTFRCIFIINIIHILTTYSQCT